MLRALLRALAPKPGATHASWQAQPWPQPWPQQLWFAKPLFNFKFGFLGQAKGLTQTLNASTFPLAWVNLLRKFMFANFLH